MKIIPPSWQFEDHGVITGPHLLRVLEQYGRTCYKSEEKITNNSAAGFVRMLIARGHESVLEHEKVTIRIVCDRGVTHEIVRHRIASYSQESTRYCNYGHEKEITVILPLWYRDEHLFFEKMFLDGGETPEESVVASVGLTNLQRRYWMWRHTCAVAQESYLDMLQHGAAPQEARSVLPNSLKTEIVITCNLREWRHFFRLRTSKAAHPQMREITIPMLVEFKHVFPIIFDDIVAEG